MPHRAAPTVLHGRALRTWMAESGCSSLSDRRGRTLGARQCGRGTALRARSGPSGRVCGRGCTWEGRAFAGRVQCFVEILRIFGIRQDELTRSHVHRPPCVHMGARQLILTGARKRRNHTERSHSPRRAPLLPCAVPSSRPDRRTPPAPASGPSGIRDRARVIPGARAGRAGWAGGEPQRQRKFVTRTYLSPILLRVDLRRMGERYVDVGKVRSRCDPLRGAGCRGAGGLRALSTGTVTVTGRMPGRGRTAGRRRC